MLERMAMPKLELDQSRRYSMQTLDLTLENERRLNRSCTFEDQVKWAILIDECLCVSVVECMCGVVRDVRFESRDLYRHSF